MSGPLQALMAPVEILGPGRSQPPDGDGSPRMRHHTGMTACGQWPRSGWQWTVRYWGPGGPRQGWSLLPSGACVLAGGCGDVSRATPLEEGVRGEWRGQQLGALAVVAFQHDGAW